jgi:hypothetical protein
MSTDHEDLDPMSDQEIAALAALDRRGRAAGAALMAAVATATADHAPTRLHPVGDDGDPTAGDEPPADFDLVHLSGRGGAGGRRPSRGWLVVAAALVLVAALAGSALARQDEDPPAVSNGRPSYLVPRWLPDGFEPYLAATTDSLRQFSETTPPTDGQVVVYGLPAEADPWAEATITVARIDRPWQPESDSGDPVTVAGKPGRAETQGEVEAVVWGAGQATYYLVGERVSREQLLLAAGSAGAEPSLDPATLPPGFAVIGQGRASDTLGLRSAPNLVAEDALLLQYLPEGATDQSRLVVVTVRPGDASDVDLARLWVTEAPGGEVNGRPAVIGRYPAEGGAEEGFVQWFEPAQGMLITVVARGVPQDEILRTARELRPAEGGEIDRLLSDYGLQHHVAATVVPDDDDADTAVAIDPAAEIATGDRAGTPWALSAGSTDSGSPWVDLDIDGEHMSVDWDADAGPGALTVGALMQYGQAERAVFGAVDDGVARVTVETGSHPADELEMTAVTLEDHSFRAFVGFVPIEGATEFTVISYDAEGREMKRAQIAIDSAVGPISPGP